VPRLPASEIPAFGILTIYQRPTIQAANVAYHDIDMSPFCECGLEHSYLVIPVGDITTHSNVVVVLVLIEKFDCRLHSFLVNIANNDMCPIGTKVRFLTARRDVEYQPVFSKEKRSFLSNATSSTCIPSQYKRRQLCELGNSPVIRTTLSRAREACLRSSVSGMVVMSSCFSRWCYKDIRCQLRNFPVMDIVPVPTRPHLT
jgi:hypothetical protein